MRVIKEDRIEQQPRDERGVHLVVDLDCKVGGAVCFAFDCNGTVFQCEGYRKQPTGVRLCNPKNLLQR